MLFFFVLCLFFRYSISSSVLNSFFPQEIQVSTKVVKIGLHPHSLIESNYFITVWTEKTVNGTVSGIHGQLYNHVGAQVGTNFEISTSTNYVQDEPSVCLLPDGTFLVVWESLGQDGSGKGIYGQLFDNFKQKLGTEFRINQKTNGDQSKPDIDCSLGYFIVIWNGVDNSGKGIYGQIYDKKGLRYFDEEFLVNSEQEGEQENGVVSGFLFKNSINSALHFIIAWESYNLSTYNQKKVIFKYFRIDIINKKIENSNENICDTLNTPDSTTVANSFVLYDESYLFVNSTFWCKLVVVWKNYVENGINKFFDISAKIYNVWIYSNQTFIVPNIFEAKSRFRGSTFIFANHSLPSVSLSKNFGFFITWTSSSQDGSGNGIFGQLFTIDGEKNGNEFQINTFTSGDQFHSRVRINDQKNIVVIWISRNFNNSGISLNFQKYYNKLPDLKFRNYKTEVNLKSFDKSTPKLSKTKILELEYSFVTVWIDEVIYIELFNTREFVITKILTINVYNISEIDVESLTGGDQFVIVWRDVLTNNINCQIFNNRGVPQTSIFLASTLKSTSTTRQTPLVKRLSNNHFIVLWVEEDSGNYSIQARCFVNQTFMGEVAINHQDYASISEISIDSSANFIPQHITIVWVAKMKNSSDSTFKIFGNWWIFSGFSFLIPKTDDFLINNCSEYTTTSISPSIVINPYWPYISIVVWAETKDPDQGSDVFAQMIDSFGGKINSFLQVNTYTQLTQESPRVVMTNNFIFITWTSFLQDSNGFGIFASVLDLMGNKQLSEWQVNTEILGDQILPTMDSLKQGDVVVVWYSSSSKSLKAQKIVPDYQADLSQEETLGFISLNKLDSKNSICSVVSDDRQYSIIALVGGRVQIVNLAYLYILKEINVSDYEIVLMRKIGKYIFVGLADPDDNLVLLNVNEWSSAFVESKNWFIKYGNYSNYIIFIEEYNEKLYIGYHYSICILNITNPLNVNVIYFWKPYGEINNANNFIADMTLNKNLVIIVDQNSFISTIDVSSEYNIKNISSFYNTVFTYTALLNLERSYLYVGTKSGFEIYSVNNNTYEYNLIGMVSLSRFIAQIKFSKDRKFLSCTSPTGHYFLTLKEPGNPQLLNFLAATNKISSTLVTDDNQYIMMSAQNGMTIQRVVIKSNNSTPYLTFVGYQNLGSPSNFAQLSPSNNIIYGLNNFNQSMIVDFNITQLETGSSSFEIGSPILDEQQFNMFVFNDFGLQIYQVTQGKTYSLIGALAIFYHDYVISAKENYVYIVSYEANVLLKVVDTNNLANPKIVRTLNLTKFQSYPNITFANKEETKLLITIEKEGILTIDISDPTNPLLNSSFVSNSAFNLITKLKENIFIVTSIERIFALNISENSITILSEIITYGSKLYAIQSLDEIYIFALTSSNLTLLDFHNVSKPVILDSTSLRIPLPYNKKLIASSKNKCVYIPFVQVYCIYSSLINYLFADISINPNSNNIEMIVSFSPVNMIKGYQIKLIKILNINSGSNWISINYDEFKISLFPSTIYDLKNILQPLEAIFVTQLNKNELSTDELNYLEHVRYIDHEFYITDKFNISKSIFVDDPSISAEKLKFVLGNHYYQRKYYFPTHAFLNLIPANAIVKPIQNQINKITQNGSITADKDFSFYLSSGTTTNHYSTSLDYSVMNLPVWLNFDSTLLRFSGTPQISDIGGYNITLSIFNGYHTTMDSFFLRVNYFAPILNKNSSLQSQLQDEPQVEIESQIFIRKDTFIDPNNDTLSYTATYNGQILPNWMQFDSSNLLLRITPTSDHFQKSYTINIVAKNRHFEVSDSLSFVVQTSWIYALKLFGQIVGPIVTIFGLIRYRNLIYNFFFKKYYIYPEENLYVDLYFEKEIYFIQSDLNLGFSLYKNLKKLKNYSTLRKLDPGTLEFKEELRNNLRQLHDDFPAFSNIEFPLFEFEGTLFAIVEGYVAHRIVRSESNKFTFQTYQNMKKMLKKTHFNHWYNELVTFSYYLIQSRDVKFQKFPTISYLDENIDKYLKMTLNKENLTRGENIIKSNIIQAILKADALGIPYKPKKWYNFVEPTRGESCFANSYDIHQINAFKESLQVEAFGNEKLPYWLKFKIKYGILTLYGTPPNHEQGLFSLMICDSVGFIIRSHLFRVLPSLQKIRNTSPIEKHDTELQNMVSKEYTILSLNDKDVPFLAKKSSKTETLLISKNFSKTKHTIDQIKEVYNEDEVQLNMESKKKIEDELIFPSELNEKTENVGINKLK